MVSIPIEKDLEEAKRVLSNESDAIKQLAKSLGKNYVDAIDKLDNVKGRVIFTGIGKSGHVARKMASTFSSTGVPSYFVHPSEASHGDLGIIDHSDAVVVISNSGETPEISDLVEYTKRHKIPLITITSNLDSLIAEQSDIALLLPKVKEACPMGLAPTTTTTMTMALGDAMAINLMTRRNFSANDFKLRHPGGKLGKQLLKVSDIMHKEDEVPVTEKDSLMSDVIIQMTTKSFGCVAVLDERKLLAGIITDGDLRRHMSDKLLQQLAEDVMTPRPKSIRPIALASEAVAVMNELEITTLFVTEKKSVVGIIHIHDCLRAGIE